MDKEQILSRLNAIVRQLSCMNNSEFDLNISNGEFLCDVNHLSFDKEYQIRTVILMSMFEIQDK